MATTNGGWNEYQRLVLAELERLNRQQATIDAKLQEIDRKLWSIAEHDVTDLKTRMTTVEAKVSSLEKVGITDDAVKKYRKWILGGVFLLITAIFIPIASIILDAVAKGG